MSSRGKSGPCSRACGSLERCRYEAANVPPLGLVTAYGPFVGSLALLHVGQFILFVDALLLDPAGRPFSLYTYWHGSQ